MTNAPSEPSEWDKFIEKVKVTDFKNSENYIRELWSERSALQAENAELRETSKLNLMTANEYAKNAAELKTENQKLREELKARLEATPTMNAVQMLARENQELRDELERAKDHTEFECLMIKERDAFQAELDIANKKITFNSINAGNEVLQLKAEVAQLQDEKDELVKVDLHSARERIKDLGKHIKLCERQLEIATDYMTIVNMREFNEARKALEEASASDVSQRESAEGET